MKILINKINYPRNASNFLNNLNLRMLKKKYMKLNSVIYLALNVIVNEFNI